MLVTDLENWLYENGWRLEHVRGSHRHYKHTPTGVRVHVAVHGRKLEPHQVRAFYRRLNRLRDVAS